MKLGDIKICDGGPNCGWTEHGNYVCYCFKQDPPDKLTRIENVIKRFPEENPGKLFDEILDIINEK